MTQHQMLFDDPRLLVTVQRMEYLFKRLAQRAEHSLLAPLRNESELVLATRLLWLRRRYTVMRAFPFVLAERKNSRRASYRSNLGQSPGEARGLFH